MRTIDAETLKSRIGELCINNYDMVSAEAYERIIGVIELVPTIEPEVRHGRWLPCLMLKYRYECGCCGEASNYPTPYCPNCGARMDGGADNG